MAKQTITVGFAWWFIPYLRMLCFMCVLFDAEPKDSHLQAVINRAIRFSS